MDKTASDQLNRVKLLTDHYNSVLNRTVTSARLVVINRYSPNRYDIAFLNQQDKTEKVAVPLSNGLFLSFYQDVEVTADGHCKTRSYIYRLQAEFERNSWLVRWEFSRGKPKPDFPYVHSHLHVNAKIAGDIDLGPLHIPTDRVPLELVLWHLITEWGVKPLSEDWQQILVDSVQGFYKRRTHEDPAIETS